METCHMAEHYIESSKIGFRPAGATRCPAKCEILVGSPVPNFTFIGAEIWEYRPQKLTKFGISAKICSSGATRLQIFYKILSICTRLDSF